MTDLFEIGVVGDIRVLAVLLLGGIAVHVGLTALWRRSGEMTFTPIALHPGQFAAIWLTMAGVIAFTAVTALSLGFTFWMRLGYR